MHNNLKVAIDVLGFISVFILYITNGLIDFNHSSSLFQQCYSFAGSFREDDLWSDLCHLDYYKQNWMQLHDGDKKMETVSADPLAMVRTWVFNEDT